MARTGKLHKFKELETFDHVFQFQHTLRFDEAELKGKWNKEFFKNDNPLVIELGCGKGEYTVGQAQKYPEQNFIGVDIKGNRIWRGAKQALTNNMNNVAFIRARIDFVENLFAENEVDKIWITFPDPQLQQCRARKRLTSPVFLNRYKNLLKKDGIIHFKTDSKELFDYTLEVIEEEGHELLRHTHNLYSDDNFEIDDILSIKTFYENMFLKEGKPICYMEFKLK